MNKIHRTSRKKIWLFLLVFCALIVGNRSYAAYQPITDSPYATLYDYRDGTHIKGPTFAPGYNVVRLSYQGRNIISDSTITGENGVVREGLGNLRDKEVARIKNVGTLNGEKLVFAFTTMDAYLNLSEKEGGVLLSTNGSVNSNSLRFWVEDSKKNKIKDDKTIFLLSQTNIFSNTQFGEFSYDYINNSPFTYLIAPSNISLMELNQYSQMGWVTTSTRFRPLSVPRPYTYGFIQKGEYTDYRRYLGSGSTILNSEIFLSSKDKGGIKIPYQAPIIYPTSTNNEQKDTWAKAELNIIQQVIDQSFGSQFADPLNIEVDFGSNIKYFDIDPSSLNAYSPKKTKIVSATATGPTTDGKVIIPITNLSLMDVGDDALSVGGMLSLDETHPSLFKDLQQGEYLVIPNVKARNNENSGITEADLKVKIPRPIGKGISNFVVLEGTNSQNLDANVLVTDLNSVIKNDTVEVVGFENDKIFNNVSTDSINVIIKSTLSGLETIVPVQVEVISKELNLLDPVKIIPENKAVGNKSGLVYQPIFEENVRFTSGDTRLDNVKIVATYGEYLTVKESDFTVYSNGKKLQENIDYTPLFEIDKRMFTATFNNNQIKAQVGKKIEIKQSSQLKDQKEILDIYNKETQKFVFPIDAYHSFGEIGSSWKITQSPITQINETIEYSPIIEAEGIPESTVALGTEVEEPIKYLASKSSPDFSFDEHVITFDQKPEFDTPGKKEFNILISSKEFGTPQNIKTVPIIVNVEEPTVNMKIKQVYSENNTKFIYSDLESEKIVDNRLDEYQVKKGDSIATLLEQIEKNNSNNFQLNYDGYNKIQQTTYKVLVNNQVQNTAIVPSEDFELIIEYEGLLKLQVSNLAYSSVSMAFEEHKISTPKSENTEDNQDIVVTNTLLNPNWKLRVALPNGIKKNQSEIVYLGGLEFKKEGREEPTIISSTGEVFASQTSQNAKVVKEIPMNINLFQELGNELGHYTGELLWTIEDTP